MRVSESYRYTLIDADSRNQAIRLLSSIARRPGGVTIMTNLFNQCLAGVKKMKNEVETDCTAKRYEH
ncbi:hypothetical protein LNQ03_09380 [Klebsiella pneumoniae subsp. pneumoniae]|nr:hypothetical protein [Klebsiella pneumoniae subsp. pneumoniae]